LLLLTYALGCTSAPVVEPTPAFVLPDSKPVGVALVVVAACTILVLGLSVIVRSTPRPLLFPVAIAIAAMPFAVIRPALDWWSGDAADSQLSLFLSSSAFAWATFRTIELSVRTTPHGANASLSEWIAYMGADLDPRYANGKPLKPPPGKLASQVGKLFGIYFLMALTVSILQPFNYRPSRSLCVAVFNALGSGGSNVELIITDVVVRVGDNFAGTLLIYLFLWMLFTIGSITVMLQGYDPIDSMLNPLFASRSPREFWGKRWNLQVNAMLKRACYKPLVAVGLPGGVAALATFGASAAFHEYQFALSMPGYTVGTASMFFLGQGLLVVVQAILEATPLAKLVPFTSIPQPFAAMINIALLSIVPDYFICNWIDLPMPLFGAVARIVPRVVW